MSGSYMHREGRAKDGRWGLEGSPSVDGPNNGNSGGTAVEVRPHIGITAPILPTGISTDQDNLYDIVPGHLTAVVINGWARTRVLSLSVYLDVRSKLDVKNRGYCS